MEFLTFPNRPDIHRGVQKFLDTPDAVLLDVRSPQEYHSGHIPGSFNLPLQELDNAGEIIENIDSPIYVYCHSGSRSRRAASILSAMGYSNVYNIGGIAGYSGKVER